ncbi:MAG: hypothetical protein QOF60_2013 [Actinomycetota bacterium]|jgi:hypothetical protein|nr:hypothetical protein [Actinomycetota bacterium]
MGEYDEDDDPGKIHTGPVVKRHGYQDDQPDAQHDDDDGHDDDRKHRDADRDAEA